jgi:hypothetical protein
MNDVLDADRTRVIMIGYCKAILQPECSDNILRLTALPELIPASL